MDSLGHAEHGGLDRLRGMERRILRKTTVVPGPRSEGMRNQRGGDREGGSMRTLSLVK